MDVSHCHVGIVVVSPRPGGRRCVPFGPGSGNDVIARIVAQKVSENWTQPVVVDNRPGASGGIGMEITAYGGSDVQADCQCAKQRTRQGDRHQRCQVSSRRCRSRTQERFNGRAGCPSQERGSQMGQDHQGGQHPRGLAKGVWNRTRNFCRQAWQSCPPTPSVLPSYKTWLSEMPFPQRISKMWPSTTGPGKIGTCRQQRSKPDRSGHRSPVPGFLRHACP